MLMNEQEEKRLVFRRMDKPARVLSLSLSRLQKDEKQSFFVFNCGRVKFP